MSLSCLPFKIQVLSINSAFIMMSSLLIEAQQQNEQKHEEIRKRSHHIADELKSNDKINPYSFYIILFCRVFVEMKTALERDEGGPKRNTADFRIRKAQVSNSHL